MDATYEEIGACSLLPRNLKDAAISRPRGILTRGTAIHSQMSPEALHEPALDMLGAETVFLCH